MTIAPAADARPWRAGLSQCMRAEWTKLASLRSTKWTLLITVVGTLFVTFVATRSDLHHSACGTRDSIPPTSP